MSILDELTTAAECVEGARQALIRAHKQAESTETMWNLEQTEVSRRLAEVHYELNNLINWRQKVEQ